MQASILDGSVQCVASEKQLVSQANTLGFNVVALLLCAFVALVAHFYAFYTYL